MKTLHLVLTCLLMVALTCISGITAIAHEHHIGDWSFGIVDGHAAVIEPEPDEIEPIRLFPFTGGLWNGDWGLEFWNLPNPDLKSVRVLFTSAPAELVLYHEDDLILGNDGSSTGPGYFDMAWPDPGIHHAHIDVYAKAWGSYTITFKLVNAVANDGLDTPIGDSEEYSLNFVTVFEPSSMLALAMPIAALVIRRRR
jgi:hypothetical protein